MTSAAHTKEATVSATQPISIHMLQSTLDLAVNIAGRQPAVARRLGQEGVCQGWRTTELCQVLRSGEQQPVSVPNFCPVADELQRTLVQARSRQAIPTPRGQRDPLPLNQLGSFGPGSESLLTPVGGSG